VEAEPLVQRLLQLQTHARAAAHEYLDAQWVDVDVFGTSLELPITQDELRRDVVHSSALALERTETGDYRLRGLARHLGPLPDITITARDDVGSESKTLLSVPEGDLVDTVSGHTLSDSQRQCVAALLLQASQQEVSCAADSDQAAHQLLRYEVMPGYAWNDPSHLSVLLTVDPSDPGCSRLLECMVFVIDRMGTSHPLAMVRFPQERAAAVPAESGQPEVLTNPLLLDHEPPHKRARLGGDLEPALHERVDASTSNGSRADLHPQAPLDSRSSISTLRDIRGDDPQNLWRGMRRQEFGPLYQAWCLSTARFPHEYKRTGGTFMRDLVALCRSQHRPGHEEWIGDASLGIMSFMVQPDGQAQPREIWIGVRNGETLDVRLAPANEPYRNLRALKMAMALDRRAAARTTDDRPVANLPTYARKDARDHWTRLKGELERAFDLWQVARDAERPVGPNGVRPSRRAHSEGADFLIAVSEHCDRTPGVSPAHVEPINGLSSHEILLPGLPAPIEVWRRVQDNAVLGLWLAPQDLAARLLLHMRISRRLKERD
jgi:hypothetical protein